MSTEQVLGEIRERMARTETIAEQNMKATTELTNSVKELVEKIGESNDLAKEADQRARSAHHRIDRLDKIVFWVGTTFAGGIIVAVVSFITKGGLAK